MLKKSFIALSLLVATLGSTASTVAAMTATPAPVAPHHSTADGSSPDDMHWPEPPHPPTGSGDTTSLS